VPTVRDEQVTHPVNTKRPAGCEAIEAAIPACDEAFAVISGRALPMPGEDRGKCNGNVRSA
jgi:hypothetical protein